jgi:hypothetical protein
MCPSLGDPRAAKQGLAFGPGRQLTGFRFEFARLLGHPFLEGPALFNSAALRHGALLNNQKTTS